MNLFSLRLFHFIYLGVLLVFIYFYFNTYQPLKLHSICAESSANKVLAAGSNTEAYNLYKSLYENCVSQKSITLLTLFSSN